LSSVGEKQKMDAVVCWQKKKFKPLLSLMIVFAVKINIDSSSKRKVVPLPRLLADLL